MKKVVFLLSLLLVFSCKTDDDSDNDFENNNSGFPLTRISGQVILPDDAPINTDDLIVGSLVGKSTVVDSQYELNVVTNDNNTLYVTNELDQVVLMSYVLPGQIDYTIDSGSSLVAMAMSLPIAQSLSMEGKINLVEYIRNREDFNFLKTQIEAVIIQGQSPLDTNQQVLGEQLSGFFNNVIEQADSNGAEEDQPVKILRQGRTFIFQNPGKSYTAYVGIYNNNQRIESLRVDRVNFVPTSISEVLLNLTGISDGPDVVEVPYTLPNENGDYEVRIRTGRQFSSDNDEDAAIALRENIFNICEDILIETIPVDDDIECARDLYNDFKEYMTVVDDFNNINTPQDMLTYAYNKISAYLDARENLLTGCDPPGNNVTKYIEAIKKKLSWLKWVGVLGNSGNLTIGAYQWYTDFPIVNECYNVTDGEVIECEPELEIVGDLNFEDVVIYENVERTFTINNVSGEDLEVSSIDLPNGFSANWTQGIITDSQEVTVTFNPTIVQPYFGTIIINNNLNSTTNTIEVLGNGLSLLRLEGDLDFGNVEVGNLAVRSLIINNDSSQDVNITNITLPEGFSVTDTSLTVPAGSFSTLPIAFTPENSGTYGGVIVLNNNITNITDNIYVSAYGGEPSNEQVLLDGEYTLEIQNPEFLTFVQFQGDFVVENNTLTRVGYNFDVYEISINTIEYLEDTNEIRIHYRETRILSAETECVEGVEIDLLGSYSEFILTGKFVNNNFVEGTYFSQGVVPGGPECYFGGNEVQAILY